MAKKAKPMPPKEVKLLRNALPWMLGMPGQVRLSAREQQRPTAFIPPKGAKRGKR
jgi:hypothetical protein